METTTTPTTTQHHRTGTQITCSQCQKTDTVPFTPTPGRRVLCGPCHKKVRARMAAPAKRIPLPPPQRMLSMRRKGHFVYDAMEALDAKGELEEPQQRAFVEMVFARGSRQTTTAALDFINEKTADGTLGAAEAVRLADVVRDYSRRR